MTSPVIKNTIVPRYERAPEGPYRLPYYLLYLGPPRASDSLRYSGKFCLPNLGKSHRFFNCRRRT